MFDWGNEWRFCFIRILPIFYAIGLKKYTEINVEVEMEIFINFLDTFDLVLRYFKSASY